MKTEPNILFRRGSVSLALMATLIASFVGLSTTSSAATLDRIRETGRIRLGYLADAPPFTYQTEAGSADGYSIGLCKRIAAAVEKRLGTGQLNVEWVAVSFEARLREVAQGSIDILCAPTSITLGRRQDVSFSIPIFPGGSRAVLRKDAPVALREALAEKPTERVVWRGSPAAKVLEKTSFAVVAGTNTEKLLNRRLATFQVDAKVVQVPDYRAGLQQVVERKADVFFGDRALILGAMNGVTDKELTILDRRLTYEPAALAVARTDEDLRLLVDRTLSDLYASDTFLAFYTKWFGEFSDDTASFFHWVTATE